MRPVESYRVRIRGIKPLLMHSPQAMMEEEGTKRKGERHDPKEEAKRGLYRDPQGKICVPAYVVKASIREASKDYKVPGKGSKTFKEYVKAGIIVEPEYIPLITPSGDPEKDWEVDLKPVVIQGNRIIRARPRFDEWELEFTVHIIDPIIRGEDLKKFIEDAGRYKGICDFRPEYGLFEVVIFERIEGTKRTLKDISKSDKS